MPAAPPALQMILAQSGMKADPQQADTRGGAWIRGTGSPFNNSPNAANASNLGEVSNSTSLMLNAMFGAFGGYTASALDILLHAAKKGPHGMEINDPDLAMGIRAAMGELMGKVVKSQPDVPLVWQGKEKYTATVPAWEYMADSMQHVRSIVGMRNEALGKTAQERRKHVEAVGGMNPQVLSDTALLHVANDLAAYQRKTGPLGQLTTLYSAMANQKKGIDTSYKLTFAERQERGNAIMKQMHLNKQQQYLAVKAFEEYAAAKYAPYLQHLLKGRPINLQTLNDMMKESIGQ